MPARAGVCFDSSGFGAAFGFLFGDPGLPGSPIGGVFTSKGQGRDLGVCDLARSRIIGGKELDPWVRTGGITVEQIPDHRLSGRELQRDIAAVIKREFDAFGQVLLRRGSKHPSLQRAGYGGGVVLRIGHDQHSGGGITGPLPRNVIATLAGA